MRPVEQDMVVAVHKTVKFLMAGVAMAALMACAGGQSDQGATQPADAVITNTNASSPNNPATSIAQPLTALGQAVQAQVTAYIDSVVSPVIMAGAGQMSQCTTQVDAIKTAVKTFVDQVESTKTAPTSAALQAFEQQLQTDIQAVVTCFCGSNADCANIGQAVNGNTTP